MRTLKFNTSRSVRYIKRGFIVAIALTASAFTLGDQTAFKSVAGSHIVVKGTSNLHDWSMTATNLTCEGTFTLKDDQLQDITALTFTLPVQSLKSKEDLMNTRAYKALKAEQFNKVTFKLSDATVLPQQKVIKANGNLSIAGVTKQVSLQTNYTVNGNELNCKGTKVIKMSDFNIKAPSFMMGALKTGDEVSIEIALKLKN